MAYGIEAHDKRIATKGTDDVNPKHEARLRAICNAVKAKGIRLDTTRNGLDGATITDMGGGTVKVSAPAASKYGDARRAELQLQWLVWNDVHAQQHFGHEGAFITRDSSNLSAGLTGARTTPCT